MNVEAFYLQKVQAQRDILFAQNSELSQKIITAQENERMVLARELHDGISQTLVSTKLLVEANLRETELQHVRPGQQALVNVICPP